MAKEIERKFLVKGDAWRALAEGVAYRQGYLNSQKERTVRIRNDDCLAMLDELAEKPIVEKKRYRIPAGPYVWEVDEFFGVNAGLVLAEIELPSEDAAFDKPEWIGEEVSGDARYFNSSLVANPYSTWKK